ncbi:MAG: polysaccharide biosynthesis/export family protein [Pseudomonadota bacterium]
MAVQRKRWAKPILALFALSLISACGLPQVGPNKREIFAGSVQKQGDAFVVAVNDRVTRAIAVAPALGFSSQFINAAEIGSDIISPGDVLGITVYENVDDPLLGVQGSPSTQLNEVQVDGSGFIFIPYAGRIKASGNSPNAIRRIITNRLGEQTPDPQVEVRRAAGDGSTVSIVGAVSGQGIYPIERPTRTLGAMLAQAGGVTIDPEIAQITVTRGNRRGKIWLQDLYDHPRLDIALRAGDRILVEEDQRTFTALGATGGQAQVRFDSQALSLLEGIARVGGLNSLNADPTGIFVFRNEPEEVVTEVLGRRDLRGAQRLIYVLDLTEPNGMFMARDFLIRDGDTVYVTEAPFRQWSKVLSAITGTAGSVSGLTSLAEN